VIVRTPDHDGFSVFAHARDASSAPYLGTCVDVVEGARGRYVVP